jgi:hypothetical protein
MKRYGNLWPQVVAFENLLQASRQAQRGKRFRPNVLAFNYNLEQELLRLRAELTQATYSPGGYRTFEIQDPKPRLISAAPYRDRVVHYALCNVIVPLRSIAPLLPILTLTAQVMAPIAPSTALPTLHDLADISCSAISANIFRRLIMKSSKRFCATRSNAQTRSG